MIKIEQMAPAHVPYVAALEKACFSDPWSEKSISSELDNPLSLWLVAVLDGTVVGYVGSQTVIDETDMMNIAVCPDIRGMGVASALVEALIEKLKAIGSRRLTLEVRISNEPAKRLYDKHGFAAVGKRPNYYYKPREDALILRKEWDV